MLMNLRCTKINKRKRNVKGVVNSPFVFYDIVSSFD
jgi:hypothetical protein